MRYERTESVVRLAREMQARRTGVSLADIASEFRVSRSTAERMRDAVLRAFPESEEVTNGERTKRWRIPSGTLNALAAPTAEELAALASAASLLRGENRDAQAAALDALSAKVRAAMRPEVARRVEPDLEALTEAEGVALRPGPRLRIDPDVLSILREAILAVRKVQIRYVARGTGRKSRLVVCPYGFLWGERNYLVAFHDYADDFRYFSLPDIAHAEDAGEAFERRPFSLADYARNAFGVFHGAPMDVVWEFSKRAAPLARQWRFHPDETRQELRDGRRRVSFRASGALEMSWHLARWGKEVKVVKPRDFAQRVREEERGFWGTQTSVKLSGEATTRKTTT